MFSYKQLAVVMHENGYNVFVCHFVDGVKPQILIFNICESC